MIIFNNHAICLVLFFLQVAPCFCVTLEPYSNVLIIFDWSEFMSLNSHEVLELWPSMLNSQLNFFFDHTNETWLFRYISESNRQSDWSGLNAMNRIQSVERRNGQLARLWYQYSGMLVVLYSSITSKRARPSLCELSHPEFV
jgi:hypothetical protein